MKMLGFAIYATLLWMSFHNVTKIWQISMHDIISLPDVMSYDKKK